MHTGKLVFAQLIDHMPLHTFRRCVAKYPNRYPALKFSHLDQFLCMAFAQLTFRESLRDIEISLRAHSNKLYHIGIRGGVARSTLTDANERRDWRIYRDFALALIRTARRLYAGDSFGVELANTVYALDTTTIDLCLALFPWAHFRHHKAAIKLHTLLDLRGAIPTFIHISEGKLQAARSQCPGSDRLRSRQLLHHGSGFLGFHTPVRHPPGAGFFCDPRQSQFAVSARELNTSGQDHWIALRSDYPVDRHAVSKQLPRAAASRESLRRRTRQATRVLDQQFRVASRNHRQAVSLPLAGRVIFQMDQTAPSHQGVLRYLGKCRQNANLDCDRRLRAGSHRQKAAGLRDIAVHNHENFEFVSF